MLFYHLLPVTKIQIKNLKIATWDSNAENLAYHFFMWEIRAIYLLFPIRLLIFL